MCIPGVRPSHLYACTFTEHPSMPFILVCDCSKTTCTCMTAQSNLQMTDNCPQQLHDSVSISAQQGVTTSITVVSKVLAGGLHPNQLLKYKLQAVGNLVPRSHTKVEHGNEAGGGESCTCMGSNWCQWDLKISFCPTKCTHNSDTNIEI